MPQFPLYCNSRPSGGSSCLLGEHSWLVGERAWHTFGGGGSNSPLYQEVRRGHLSSFPAGPQEADGIEGGREEKHISRTLSRALCQEGCTCHEHLGLSDLGPEVLVGYGHTPQASNPENDWQWQPLGPEGAWFQHQSKGVHTQKSACGRWVVVG